jgi:hypothetical protein
MASKLISALAATALLAAAPTVAFAQDDGDDSNTAEALGVAFALIAAAILIADGGGDRPRSP